MPAVARTIWHGLPDMAINPSRHARVLDPLAMRGIHGRGSAYGDRPAINAGCPNHPLEIQGEPEHGVSGSFGGFDGNVAVGSTIPVEGGKGCQEGRSPSGPAVLGVQVGTPARQIGDVGLKGTFSGGLHVGPAADGGRIVRFGCHDVSQFTVSAHCCRSFVVAHMSPGELLVKPTSPHTASGDGS